MVLRDFGPHSVRLLALMSRLNFRSVARLRVLLLFLTGCCCRSLLLLLGIRGHKLLASVAIRTDLFSLLRKELREVHSLRKNDIILI